MHMVNWDSLCRPSAEGGLGFKLLRQMNMALLCTWYNGRIHDGREFCGLSTGVQWRRVGKENIYLISGEVYSMTGSFWKWILESSCYAVLVMRSPAANRRTEQVYCKNSISNGNWDCSWDSERWLVWRIWRMKGPRRLNMHLWQVRGINFKWQHSCTPNRLFQVRCVQLVIKQWSSLYIQWELGNGPHKFCRTWYMIKLGLGLTKLIRLSSGLITIWNMSLGILREIWSGNIYCIRYDIGGMQ